MPGSKNTPAVRNKDASKPSRKVATRKKKQPSLKPQAEVSMFAENLVRNQEILLQQQAATLMEPGKGILAVDESMNAIDNCLRSMKLSATENNSVTELPSESLETTDGGITWQLDEPNLQISGDELGSPVYIVDAMNEKKLTRKDIERQNIIWELISTEKHYVNRLNIMYKTFARTMLRTMKYTQDQVNRLFPRINELAELHEEFLHQLLNRQAKSDDRFVHKIGDILLEQFQGVSAEKMKLAYGVFCSKHKEAMQLYKDFLKNDKSFQSYVKYCSSLPVCEKREISDFILGVTVRLSKYQLLIEAILKNTKEKEERLLLTQAVQACKNVMEHVNERVDAYEKLVDIQSKMDNKTVTFKDKKFKRQDLSANNRELVHVGKIGWMSARGRVQKVIAVVLTDIIIFLQNNEHKYTFVMQDNKCCIIPLDSLLVRKRGDMRGSLAIYLISQNPDAPEMYEVVCQSKKEREEWVRILQHAVKSCRKDAETHILKTESRTSQVIRHEITPSNMADENKRLEVANKVKSVIEQLHQQDEMIKTSCEEKKKLTLQLMELNTSHRATIAQPTTQEIDRLNEPMEIVFAAMREASQLTGILQSAGYHLNRSTSSIGEQHSIAHVTATIPRRAETFSGFDVNCNSLKNRRLYQVHGDFSEDVEETPTYMTNANQQDRSRSGSYVPDTILESKTKDNTSHSWKMQLGSSISSEQGFIEEMSAASISPTIPTPEAQDHVGSVLQLVQYLSTLMNVTAQQCTKVESLRAELADAKTTISKLRTDVHNHNLVQSGYRQLEEFRQLQDSLIQEKQEWATRKRHDSSQLQLERDNLEAECKQIEKEKMKLRSQQEVLRRDQETMRNEWDRVKEFGFQMSSPVYDASGKGDLENVDSSILDQRFPGHLRSISENVSDTVTANDTESYSPYTWMTTNEFPYQAVESAGSQEDYLSSAISQTSFPYYSVSTNFESGITEYLPSSSVFRQGDSTVLSQDQGNSEELSQDQESPVGLSRIQSMSAASRIPFRYRRNNRRSPSDSSLMARLSQQKGKP